MKISSRGRYAVRIMAELARTKDVISVNEISQSQGITIKYTEKIIRLLVKNGLVKSARGAFGGYVLLKDASQYTIAEILTVTGDMPLLAPCFKAEIDCPRKQTCKSFGVWEQLDKLIYDYLSNVTLDKLC